MRECERISDLFVELHDNQMDGVNEKHARQHLYDCPDCREEFRWYGITVQALNHLDRVSPPPDFIIRLNSRLETSPSFFDFFRNLFVGAPYVPLPVGAAALALIVVTSIALYNPAPLRRARPTTESGTSSMMSLSSGARNVVAPLIGLHSKSFIAANSMHPIPTTGSGVELLSSYGFPTRADMIGADNLTVESSSIDNAVESVKRILPILQGRLVNEQARRNLGQTVLAVLIPSNAYGNLTTELINHGAIASGASGPGVSQAKKEGNKVLLYIRFVHTH
jgi:hypothetical protein